MGPHFFEKEIKKENMIDNIINALIIVVTGFNLVLAIYGVSEHKKIYEFHYFAGWLCALLFVLAYAV